MLSRAFFYQLKSHVGGMKWSSDVEVLKMITTAKKSTPFQAAELYMQQYPRTHWL